MTIKTWQERSAEWYEATFDGVAPRQELMQAEIDELRAALANQPAPTVPAAVYHVERNRCDCHPETCCCNAWAIVRVEGEQRKKHSTHAARTVADEIARALAHQSAQEQAEPTWGAMKWAAEEIADACVKAGLGIFECNALLVTLKADDHR